MKRISFFFVCVFVLLLRLQIYEAIAAFSRNLPAMFQDFDTTKFRHLLTLAFLTFVVLIQVFRPNRKSALGFHIKLLKIIFLATD